MNTKLCPFCGEEISHEAIICKFCHRLLIDENYEEITSPAAAESEPAEEKTMVYSKDELKKAMDAATAEKSKADETADDPDYETTYDDEEPQEERVYEESYDGGEYAPEAEDGEIYDDGVEYAAGEYTYDEQTEEYAEDDGEYYDELSAGDGEVYEEAPVRYRSAARDAMMDDIPAADVDPKRTFIITIIITLGILLIVIAAIVVGFKLFGYSDDSSSLAPVDTAPIVVNSQPETTPASTDYQPEVTNDTVSESPEETSNSGLADPVVSPDSQVILPDTSAADTALDSAADSSADSAADSAADSSSAPDESAADDSSEAANDGPAGEYYSWDEAFDLIANYFANNGMNGTYEYSYGSENQSMTFQYYDENGNPAGLYTVDLYTGEVYAV